MKKEKKIKEEAIKEYLDFEKNMLSKPHTFFHMIEHSINSRDNIIWNEFIDWQKSGGKVKLSEIREKKTDDGKIMLFWDIKNEHFGQIVEKNIDKEVYKAGIDAIYSFIQDRPQYYKFRNMEGMFNPLKLLLYHFIKPLKN